eukprot:s5262_g5.t1
MLWQVLREVLSSEQTSANNLQAQNCRHVPRRTDFLVGVDAAPTAVALILEVSKAGEEQGEMVLSLGARKNESELFGLAESVKTRRVSLRTALVRMGRLVVGQNLSVATGLERNRLWLKCDHASVGVAVQLTGLRTRKVGGDCDRSPAERVYASAVDDLLIVLPRERAWLWPHELTSLGALVRCAVLVEVFGVFGPPLEVAWENDAQIQARTEAAFEREHVENPEKHSGSAYDRRWDQPAVEEVSGLAPAFSKASRREFQSPFQPSSGDSERAPREASPPRLVCS